MASGTPNGSVGTISINSVPPFAAPSVRSGPIQIPVTVGTPPNAQDTAGVLLFGGQDSSQTVAPTPEIYDTTSKQVVPTAAPVFASVGNSTTLLQNGDILIAGGSTVLSQHPDEQPSPVINQAQLFHPTTRTFSATGSMNVARRDHTATLLPDGKVLITGGQDNLGGPTNSAELYDPATGKFTQTDSMIEGRRLHTASLISQPGQGVEVVVYSGVAAGVIDQRAEYWKEDTGAFSPYSAMASAQLGFPQPVPLRVPPDGSLEPAIVGGFNNNGQPLPTELTISPATLDFRDGLNLKVARFHHTLTALPALNELIVIGGTNGTQALNTAEIRGADGWKLASGSAGCPQGCLNTARSSHTATLLPDGTVLVAGGIDQDNSIIAGTEIYYPASNAFTLGPQASLRALHSATLFATSTTTINASPNPASSGQSVMMSATVSSLTGTPAGSVQFFDGSTLLSSTPLSNGQASLTTKTLSTGSHSITAVYSGNGIPAASKSDAVTEVIK